MKLFISYSHKDEKYKDQLETQLSILRRNKIVTSWHDRKIIAGQEWKDEIDNNLENSEIILLLVSPDFLDSDYCYENEMVRAIERHNNKETVVIPIILRPCDWHETPFSKLQALPKDAKAISLWGNVDEAWLDVVTALKKSIELTNKKRTKEIVQEIIWTKAITEEFSDWLNDTEIELKHRRVEKVSLDDVFVLPDVKVLNDDIDVIAQSVNARQILIRGPWSLVFGDEQSGKTTLSKYFFKEQINSGRWPILLRGEDIKSTDIMAIVKEISAQQYTEIFNFISAQGKVLIIDNFSNCKLNKKHQNKLIDNIKDNFEKVILIAIDSYQYVVPEIEALDGFTHYEILNFGNIKRTELIEKWVSMGVVEEIDEAIFYSEVDDLKIKIEALTRGGILPSKPIYLLSLLQMFESLSPQKVELTSYGHCYQYLIYQALEKARVKNSEIEKYINFLTELGCTQFNNNGIGLDDDQLDEFYKEYESKYLSIDKQKMIEVLIGSGILVSRNDRLSFKYSYIYYFFAAKKLAESFTDDKLAKKNIQRLLTNLHREDCANIIIFITHHTRSDWILDEIQLCMMELFDDFPEARLEKESLEFMIEFLKDIPELVLEHRKVEDERHSHDQHLEKVEAKINNDKEENDSLETTDFFAKVNRAFKGIEIIGQIIRNRHGSLSKDKLEQLTTQAYGVGLRFLQFFLTISDVSKEEVVKLIEHWLQEKPSITNEKLEKEARSIFLLLTYGAIYGVLRKVSMSVGSKEAEKIYKNIEASSPSPAVKLINQAIYLQFNKNLDAKAVKALAEEFSTNPTCERLLKEIVIQHIYMFPVEYRQKQKIAEILKIPVSSQLLVGMQKSFQL